MVPSPHLSRYPGARYISSRSLNPTGSFKDRGIAMAMTDACTRGRRRCLRPTGNTRIGRAYATRAG